MTANELAQLHQGALRDLAKSLGVKVGRMTREQMAAAIVAAKNGAHRHACSEPGCPGAECYAGAIDGCGHPTKSAADPGNPCPWSRWPCSEADARHATTLRRRVLATIATEAPGQDVAGVFVIDDALRIDFVSGAALLVGADGTLSWETAASVTDCVCGHEADWHAAGGRGDCEHGTCRCAEFRPRP